MSPLAGKYGVPVVNLFRSAAFSRRLRVIFPNTAFVVMECPIYFICMFAHTIRKYELICMRSRLFFVSKLAFDLRTFGSAALRHYTSRTSLTRT